MIKLKNLLLVSAAALALGACSSDEKIVLDPESPTGFDPEGNGYINISINMPGGGGSGTRADATLTDANDQTADGDAKEYEVNDATLLLFTGNTNEELNATLAAAYDLSLTWNKDVDDDHITMQGYKTQKIVDDGKDYIFAMVVLNRNNVFTIDTDKRQIKFGETTFEGTFGQLSQKIAEDGDFYKSSTSGISNFFMTNAVLSKQAGNTETAPTTTFTLTPISKESQIFKTEEAAKASADPVHVIVERAVAKIQLAANASEGGTTTVNMEDITVNGETAESGSSLTGLTLGTGGITWKLNNKNTKSYLVRNWNQDFGSTYNTSNTNVLKGDSWLSLKSDGDGLTTMPGALTTNNDKYNPYRFAGYTQIKATTGSVTEGMFDPSTCYRTYWGVDPNYCDNLVANDASASDDADYVAPGIKYCLENTFDVPHQTQENTTLAMVKVQFKLPTNKNNGTTGSDANTNTFYVLNNTKKIVYTRADMEAKIKEASEIANNAANTNNATITITFQKKGSTSDMADTDNGTIEIKSVKIGESTTLSADDLKSLNAKFVIDRYLKGVAYYPILIKHFGDDLTPWNSTTKTTGNAYKVESESSSSTSADNRWLGRYGVLRNNWYLLNITGISNLGYAEPPTPDTTTDDEVEAWINVRVSMLSWAKRQQDIKL